ncbi:hypothetical protein F968_01382 [Acinetobacter sp. NIPH 817]|nr:hypothetical protein F968_01382 [Acinetobacter sp. NIPH 817]
MNFISLFLLGMNLGIFKNEGKLKRSHKVFKVIKKSMKNKNRPHKGLFFKTLKITVLIHLS